MSAPINLVSPAGRMPNRFGHALDNGRCPQPPPPPKMKRIAHSVSPCVQVPPQVAMCKQPWKKHKSDSWPNVAMPAQICQAMLMTLRHSTKAKDNEHYGWTTEEIKEELMTTAPRMANWVNVNLDEEIMKVAQSNERFCVTKNGTDSATISINHDYWQGEKLDYEKDPRRNVVMKQMSRSMQCLAGATVPPSGNLRELWPPAHMTIGKLLSGVAEEFQAQYGWSCEEFQRNLKLFVEAGYVILTEDSLNAANTEICWVKHWKPVR